MMLALMAASQRIARRPLRSILTILAVALGSLAVSLALNLLQARALAALPSNVFRVISGENGSDGFNFYQLFTNDDLDKFRKLIPDAEVVEAYTHAISTYLEYKNQRFKIVSSARVNPQYVSVQPIEILNGEFLTSENITSSLAPLVLSESVAEQVFSDEDPLGKTVRFAAGFTSLFYEPYRVVGVFRDPIESGNGSVADYAYVPYRGASSRFGDSPVALVIKAKPGASKSAQIQALDATRMVFKGDDLFQEFKGAVFTTTSTNAAQSEADFDPQALLFAGFAIIMLITCSIGIFSIQMVEISERTRDIGMRRALGATQNMIVLEILASALLLAGSGAVIGVLASLPVLPIIKQATGPFLFAKGLEFSPIVALEVVGIVLVVGVLLGFYPALLASRLKPVEALREM
jgi:putative ABC transport system permease protein